MRTCIGISNGLPLPSRSWFGCVFRTGEGREKRKSDRSTASQYLNDSGTIIFRRPENKSPLLTCHGALIRRHLSQGGPFRHSGALIPFHEMNLFTSATNFISFRANGLYHLHYWRTSQNRPAVFPLKRRFKM